MIEGIPVWSFLLLGAGTFLVTFFVSAIGPTGGLQLFTVAALLPPHLAIPVHGWIAGVSACFRMMNLRRHIDWRYFWWFAAPSVALTIGGAVLAFELDARLLRICIGAYIVLSALLGATGWTPRGRTLAPHPAVAGAATGFATVFIGATGPLLFAMMMPRYPEKERLMGTHSICLTLQHAAKIVMFGLLGVALLEVPLLIVTMTAVSWLGTHLGSKVLIRISETLYRSLLTVVMVAGGLFIVASAL